MADLILMLTAALLTALATPIAVASLRAHFPGIPPAFLERTLVL